MTTQAMAIHPELVNDLSLLQNCPHDSGGTGALPQGPRLRAGLGESREKAALQEPQPPKH